MRESLVPLSLGFPVRILEDGEGPPVLLLHGNPDSADEWRAVIPLLRDRFRCIAPDFPGYGRSPRVPEGFAYDRDAQVAFVDAVLEATGVTEPIVLVVHDIGGFVGTPWAAANLDRLRGMVFNNTVAFEGFRWFSTALAWGARSRQGRLRARLIMWLIGLFGGALFRRAFGAQSPQLTAERIDAITRLFACNPAAKDATLRQFRHATRSTYFEGFDAMNTTIVASRPTRVVWGEGDVYIDDAYARRLGCPDVRTLPGVGHWVPLVAPEVVVEAIEAVVSP